MGSEVPKPVTINVTGFKKFHGVAENPTETIVNNLKNYVEKKGLPAGVSLGSCLALETAGQSALPVLCNIMDSGVPIPINSNDEKVVWLHLGVNNATKKFAIERQAFNEATFRCPDELGWTPEKEPIVPEDGEISRTRKTSCSIEGVLEFLKNKGYDTTISDNAGRFVCNYVYYHSLRLSEKKGHKSLFVHIPLFSTINEETQMEFILALLEAIATTY